MKKGRPKDIKTKKGRSHYLVLSERAEIVLREIRKQRPSFNLCRYLSQHLINDFQLNNLAYKKFRIKIIQKEIDGKYEEINRLAEQIKEKKIKEAGISF